MKIPGVMVTMKSGADEDPRSQGDDEERHLRGCVGRR